MAAGVGRIPEDRHASLVLDLPGGAQPHPRAHRRLHVGWPPGLDRRRIEAHAQELIERFAIKARPQRPGGHAVGRQHPEGAAGAGARRATRASSSSRSRRAGSTWVPREYVRDELLARRRAGAAILLISEDLDELLSLSDRVVVLYEGRVVGRMARLRGRPRAPRHAHGRPRPAGRLMLERAGAAADGDTSARTDGLVVLGAVVAVLAVTGAPSSSPAPAPSTATSPTSSSR